MRHMLVGVLRDDEKNLGVDLLQIDSFSYL